MSTPTTTEVVLAHAALHCNLNTVDLAAAEAFYTEALGLRARMRSISVSTDGTPMGLGPDTASTTAFLWDHRGPRAAPALELVGWERPATVPAETAPRGFVAVGFRVNSLPAAGDRLRSAGAAVDEVPPVPVRGSLRSALRTVDPDGVTVEIVEVADADDSTAALSHLRVYCTDLARATGWYEGIGFVVGATGAGTASVALPEDPTFSLELTEHPAAPQTDRAANTQGLYRIALAVDDVRAAHAVLAERTDGVPEPVFIPMPDIPTGGFTVLFLADPDGAVVELVERPRSAVRRPVLPV
ncbi:VOC family protein [Cryptosporangium aurantiacum]|uniref:Catechol 2,3-dioxygenase n=1 Tax=Cryptosporangium aurantiacum TaxID=134849 RepID=A0A1M7PGV5_9ACTN|nr:VOC family protein [Cryptosporangium aurantiacum]SHN16306.1 Catechol 2,3-dioxygenase [Cryptosporangium aurantiacum]